jgi:EAL domain-containing protein (putative c-di-GMP-specific phosphodiesterase class I)
MNSRNALQLAEVGTETARVLIVDDDAMVRDAVLAMLERRDRRVVVCSDAASAEIALREFRFTHIISDLQLSQIPFEGVSFVDSARRALPDSRIVVMTGYSSPIVKSTALAVGADAFLAKPFDSMDMERALRLEASGGDDVPADAALRVSDIDELLSGGGIEASFQPILDFFSSSSSIYGFEALARVPAGWPFHDMSTLFEYARHKDRSAEINAACVERALRSAARRLTKGLLFVNVGPDVIGSRPFLERMRVAVAESGIAPQRIVIELTENAGAYDAARAIAGIDALRREGMRFAIDDAENAADNLRLIEQIRPAYMKIGHRVGASFQLEGSKSASVRRVVALAAAISAEVILEGIDSRETLLHARRYGIRYGQGFWLGAPMDAAAAAELHSDSGRRVRSAGERRSALRGTRASPLVPVIPAAPGSVSALSYQPDPFGLDRA